ncbi:MAG: DNA polymerase clamp loader subunit A, partial [Nanoarchaeota archaeon]
MIKSAFDWVKEIMTNKRPWSSFTDEEKNNYNVFMVNKVLSMTPDYVEVINYVQKIPYTEKEKYYRVYCEMIPKKYIFSKYIKSSKKTANKDVLEKVAQFYECSLGEAEEYVSILRKEGVVDILNKLGIEEKEQKKLI